MNQQLESPGFSRGEYVKTAEDSILEKLSPIGKIFGGWIVIYFLNCSKQTK
jgi:hypothetical protein